MFEKVFKSRGFTLLLPIVVIGCAAPAAYNADTGKVAIRPASSNLIQQGAVVFEKRDE